jgi:general nucleoside transport system ATP-binding protein
VRDTPVVALDHVTKRFKTQLALDGVSLAFFSGELHAVVGENGAGKSTLMNILFGLHAPDEGGILLDGREVVHRRPSDAIANGIGMVHQHFKLVPSFTVAENIRLAALPGARRRLGTDRDIIALSERYGLALDPAATTDTLPLAIQQRVEIFKALVNEAKLLILDEPTTILNPRETDTLYGLLRNLAGEGRAVVVVTHHLDEVLRYSDRVSVIRQGKLVGTDATATVDRATLVQRIVGRAVELDARIPRTAEAIGPEELRLVAVSVPGTAYSSGLRDADLSLSAGEVVGIAGVEGNGQRELFEVLAGLRVPSSGELRWREHSADGSPPASLVPEDRHTEGLVLDLSVSLNLLLDQLGSPPYSHLGRLRHGAITSRAKELAAAFNVRAASIDLPARSLSGGNQQKIVIARALQGSARVLVVYQPTRGLDIAASEEVLTRLRRAAGEGIAVLMISSNLTEILRTSDRVVVLFEGRIAGETSAADADIARIGTWMVGGDEQPSADRGAAA